MGLNSDMAGLLEGKICLVTGAARGIGRAVAELFSAEGAIVYANARQDGCLDAWVEKVTAENDHPVFPLYFDVTDTKNIGKAFTRIKKEQGRLDALVNNAGITKNELIGMIRESTVQSLFATNVFAVIQMMQQAARLMRSQESGAIVNISSIIGVEGHAGEMVYSGTKGAVISMTKSAAKELAPYHIRVNAVAPGYTDTEMFRGAVSSPEMVENLTANIGFGRLASAEDIAQACAWLACDRSGFVTGQILGVNGSTII